ncbi:MAG TPA: hypothetical protein QF508_02880, partial [Candidatus Thalassarchaeaceae archaeon]|nr:hypothetical protein [Candidatus Thalassarchaeaceae archaeon]
WVATYITMSAPLGRIIDRHIKILRYGRHPLIIAGDTIPETCPVCGTEASVGASMCETCSYQFK